MTADTDDTWHPGATLEPGRPCPPHIRDQIRAALEAGRQAEAERLQLIRQREEHK